MKQLILYILLAAVLTACRDLEQPITREFTEAAYWRDEQDALDALAACYENMFSAEYFFTNEALSDNAYYKDQENYGAVGKIASGSYDASNGRVRGEWGYHYTCIRKCNIVVENIHKVPAMDETLRRRIVAEARAIRAYAYFQLVTWYGDVPFYTHLINIDEAKTISRTSKDEVLRFVLDELAAVQPDLPTNENYEEKDRGRITRGAAIALRARVNLYQGAWQEVVNDCEKLIGRPENGAYALHNDYKALFTTAREYNSEVIMDLQFGGGRTHNFQRFFLPQTVGLLRSNLVPTQDLVDDYIMLNGKGIHESGSGYNENDPYTDRDPRFEAAILHHGSRITDFEGRQQTILTQPGSNPPTNSVDDQGASATGYYFYKYYDPTAANYNSGLNLILIRYADVLLMYAEAKNELGQMNQGVWDQTIRPLRLRAGFTQAAATEFNSTLGQAALREVIRRERRSELAFEGLRIFDIRRWQIAHTVLNRPVRGIKVSSGAFEKDPNGYIIVERRSFVNPKHYLWPVPVFERDQNPNLSQNQDW